MKKLLLLAPLLTGCGTNIGGGITLPSNFDWTPPTEEELFVCDITEPAGTSQHWCENGYDNLCNC